MEYTLTNACKGSEATMEPKAPGAKDIITDMQRTQLEAAEILATILRTITGEAPDAPTYKDPEHMLMALACCHETSNYIRNMAERICASL